jgi:hypothetical protein
MSYHPQGVYRFCKMLCGDVSLIEGYAEGDFTIVMKKGINKNVKSSKLNFSCD